MRPGILGIFFGLGAFRKIRPNICKNFLIADGLIADGLIVAGLIAAGLIAAGLIAVELIAVELIAAGWQTVTLGSITANKKLVRIPTRTL